MFPQVFACGCENINVFTYYGVVWHTGKVVACSAVSPRFKPQQDQGFFLGSILFCVRMAHYSSGKGRLV